MEIDADAGVGAGASGVGAGAGASDAGTGALGFVGVGCCTTGCAFEAPQPILFHSQLQGTDAKIATMITQLPARKKTPSAAALLTVAADRSTAATAADRDDRSPASADTLASGGARAQRDDGRDFGRGSRQGEAVGGAR